MSRQTLRGQWGLMSTLLLALIIRVGVVSMSVYVTHHLRMKIAWLVVVEAGTPAASSWQWWLQARGSDFTAGGSGSTQGKWSDAHSLFCHFFSQITCSNVVVQDIYTIGNLSHCRPRTVLLPMRPVADWWKLVMRLSGLNAKHWLKVRTSRILQQSEC